MDFQLNPNAQTFAELQKGNYPWWDNLKKNKNISIQIRKDNTIDAYYNGGAILGGLKFDARVNCFTASIHPKYIPLKDEKTYQPLALNAEGVKFTAHIDPLALAQLGEAELKAVIARVKKYHDSDSEKAVQYQFAANDPYIIDTEFQIGNDLRIDLIRLDASVQKIVFIEVKTMGDPRLFVETTGAKENIHDQLEKYKNFAAGHSREIIEYYAKVLQIKNDLGITKPEVKELTLTGWDIEPKPLLVFGDCEQKWIDQNAEGIDSKIKGVAYGAYYFGGTEYSLDLVPKTQRNRHIV